MKDHHLFGTTWKSKVSITKWDLGYWGTKQTPNCWFIHCGKIQIKIWKPKKLRKSWWA